MIFPELTQLHVTELRYLHQILHALLPLLGSLHASPGRNIRRKLNLLDNSFISLPVIQLEYILESGIPNEGVLDFIDIIGCSFLVLIFLNGPLLGADLPELDACSYGGTVNLRSPSSPLPLFINLNTVQPLFGTDIGDHE